MRTEPHALRAKTLSAVQRLPLDPAPVAAVMQCDPGDPDQLIKALKRSPVLAGRVIGVANSAGSSAVHRMESIDRCVHHLGAKQARTVALTLAMQLMVQDLPLDEELLPRLWVSATTKAVAAQLVAEAVSPSLADSAYSHGLLQDVALPVLLALDPGYFNSRLAESNGRTPWTELERSHFGIDHAELGAQLLLQWGVPSTIVTQVGRHHAPLADDDMAWVADMPARFAGLLPHLHEQTTNGEQQTLAAAHARFLCGKFKTVDALMKEIQRRVKAMGPAAGGPVKPNPEFIEHLARAVAEDTFALAAQVSRLDRQLSEQIDTLAHTQEDALSDVLTGLLNRRGFDSIGRQLLAQANKAGQPAACLVIDLDDFKPINDDLGHAAGDTVLSAAADLIKASVCPGDLVARMGGDEFAVLIIGDGQGDTHALAQRLHAVCNGRRIAVSDGCQAVLRMSIGGVFIPAVPQNAETALLMDAADQVMYAVKRGGKCGLGFEAMNRAA